MWKKYLLATANDPGTLGFFIGFLPFFIIGITLFASTNLEWGTSILCVSIPAGLVLCIVTLYGKDKYITDVNDNYRDIIVYRSGDSRLVRVENDLVVENGPFVWGKENVYLITIPKTRKNGFSTSTSLTRQLGDVSVSVNVSLVVEVFEVGGENDAVIKGGFILQELYDVVIKSGHDSVENWLAASFKKTAEETPSVQLALETHGKNPYALIDAVQKALHDVQFNKQLSNIMSIKATVVANSASFKATVSY